MAITSNAVSEHSDGVVINVRVVPGAKNNGIAEITADFVRIRISAPAVEGKANKALTEFLSKRLGVARRSLEVLRGEHSREKQVLVSGISKADVLVKLEVVQG